jgi:uncharacterized protein GlcG (DUF336 family)
MAQETTGVRNVPTITAEAAQQLIDAVATAAEQAGKPMVISVCDPSGQLVAFRRMDGAPLLSIGIAQDKAFSAAAFGLPTDQWHEFIKDDPPLSLGIVHTPRLVTFGGGYPLKSGDAVIGALGLSGGHYSEDMQIAEAGLAACGYA